MIRALMLPFTSEVLLAARMTHKQQLAVGARLLHKQIAHIWANKKPFAVICIRKQTYF